MWLRVEIVTVSAYVAAERSRIAPLGVLLHAVFVTVAASVVTLSVGMPGLFIIACVALAIVCVGITAAGAGMRWTGTFTFIPVLFE